MARNIFSGNRNFLFEKKNPAIIKLKWKSFKIIIKLLGVIVQSNEYKEVLKILRCKNGSIL